MKASERRRHLFDQYARNLNLVRAFVDYVSVELHEPATDPP